MKLYTCWKCNRRYVSNELAGLVSGIVCGCAASERCVVCGHATAEATRYCGPTCEDADRGVEPPDCEVGCV